MKNKVEVRKITKNANGYQVNLPKKMAEENGFTGGYVNIYFIDDKFVIEKTFGGAK